METELHQEGGGYVYGDKGLFKSNFTQDELKDNISKLKSEIDRDKELLEVAKQVMLFSVNIDYFLINREHYPELFISAVPPRSEIILKGYELDRTNDKDKRKLVEFKDFPINEEKQKRYKDLYLNQLAHPTRLNSYRKFAYGFGNKEYDEYFATEEVYDELEKKIIKNITQLNADINKYSDRERIYNPFINVFPKIDNLSDLLDKNPTKADLILLKSMVQSAYQLYYINRDTKIKSVPNPSDEELTPYPKLTAEAKKNIAKHQITEYLFITLVAIPIGTAIGLGLGGAGIGLNTAGVGLATGVGAAGLGVGAAGLGVGAAAAGLGIGVSSTALAGLATGGIISLGGGFTMFAAFTVASAAVGTALSPFLLPAAAYVRYYHPQYFGFLQQQHDNIRFLVRNNQETLIEFGISETEIKQAVEKGQKNIELTINPPKASIQARGRNFFARNLSSGNRPLTNLKDEPAPLKKDSIALGGRKHKTRKKKVLKN